MRGLLWLAAIAFSALGLAGCQDSQIPKDIRPVPPGLVSRMSQLQMSEIAPVLFRIFKEESALEVWKQTASGQYALLKTYKICKWSGVLGPKLIEGDRQAPEGFYDVTPAQMNPASHYYLSFNVGYPNAYDQALGRTGSDLMVHGACSSSGCYSMTDADAGEIFALARDAFKGGQTDFQIEAFPFRMTPENLARHHDDPNMPFWRMLKVGYDHFEVTHQPPKVNVCNRAYVFDADAGNATFKASAPCPAYTIPEPIATAVSAKQTLDDQKYQEAMTRLSAKASKDAGKDDLSGLPFDIGKPSAKVASAAAAPVVRVGTDTALAEIIPPLPRPSPLTVPAATPAPMIAIATPIPRLKPDPDTLPVIKVSAEPKPAMVAPKPIAAAAPVAKPAEATVATAAPTVGKLVKRKVYFDDSEFGDPPASATN